MKTIVILSLVALSFNLFAGNDNPPGTVKIEENLYCDVTEVSNLEWKEYMLWAKRKYGEQSKKYEAVLPDTLVWRQGKYNEPYVQYYYQHPAYQNYPVIGISYEQATAFCKWRSDRVNEKIYIEKHKINPEQLATVKNIPNVYTYRLPTKAEWEKIARADYSKKAKRKFKRKKYRNAARHNFKTAADKNDNGITTHPDITNKVDAYWANSYGVYNILGNVAEMIAEKGVAKGGSWRHKAEEVTIEKDFSYDGSADWLGFRCVCEKNADE